MSEAPGEITRILAEIHGAGEEALTRILPIVYGDLRRLAAHYMNRERIGHTLQPTALVNEAYLRLLAQDRTHWQSRAHFFGVAAQLMRRILVDHARKRHTRKREAPLPGEAAWREPAGATLPLEEVLAVDEGLERLAKWDAQQARVVELRYFGGMSVEETAEFLGISPRTVKRDWSMARAWLHAELSRKEAK